jgi:hypothetical protein
MAQNGVQWQSSVIVTMNLHVPQQGTLPGKLNNYAAREIYV